MDERNRASWKDVRSDYSYWNGVVISRPVTFSQATEEIIKQLVSLLVKLIFLLPDALLKVLVRGGPKTAGERTMSPGIQFILSLLEKNSIRGDITSIDPKVLRNFYDEMAGVMEKKPPSTATKDHTIDVDQDTIQIREYTPGKLDGTDSALVYLHGGGWCIGSIKTHDIVCKHLANLLGWKVFSVGYRLAPEHKYPIPLEDCDRAFEWVWENAESFNINPEKISIGGDSAGGNLSTSVCIKRKEEGRVLPERQLLIYPGVDRDSGYQSMQDFAEGYFLTEDLMTWFTKNYIRSNADLDDFYVSPIRYQNPLGLPPAVVITAGFDPLRDMGIAYAKHLRDSGVKVTEREYQSMIHGFANFTIDRLAYSAVVEFAADLKNIV